MIMCHMIADTTSELLDMADAIGVDRKWIQHAGEDGEHFDISLGKRALAVRKGAQEITVRTFALKIRARRSAREFLERTIS